MKIGILECDTLPDDLQGGFPDYPHMLIRSFRSIDCDFEYNVYNVTVNDFPGSINECDAYITTGSRSSVNDSKSWIATLEKLVVECDSTDHRLVGICFGHQLIARALQGRVERSKSGLRIGLIKSRILSNKSWMNPVQDHINMIISHEDHVVRLPAGAGLLASNSHCKNFMFQYRNFLGIQGHPEFSKEYCRALMKLWSGTIPEDRLTAGYKSLEEEPDNRLVMQWIRDFITA
jgi:GMP synthase (glutamine-hydrolysing)